MRRASLLVTFLLAACASPNGLPVPAPPPDHRCTFACHHWLAGPEWRGDSTHHHHTGCGHLLRGNWELVGRRSR